VAVGDLVVDAELAARRAGIADDGDRRWTSTRRILEAGPSAIGDLGRAAAELAQADPRPAGVAALAELRLGPPVPDPDKIVCLGLNYRGHALEQKKEPPEQPLLFAKAPSALAGPYDDIVIRRGVEKVDAEAELAVVIGREGTMIPAAEALSYVAGYMAFNDVSARAIQHGDKQWFRGKSFDTFAPCGPWIVTANELGDPGSLAIRQRLGDVVMQESTTADMTFDVASIVSHISQAMTLMPGDVVATGTPAGVGVFREPPVFLKDGDVVTVEIERIGAIRNMVRAL
jgi:2-keto-4-pentenoate hydratase/2-oxohepta-3-ene-1,7-dioic acid hydratase in catechol pathway